MNMVKKKVEKKEKPAKKIKEALDFGKPVSALPMHTVTLEIDEPTFQFVNSIALDTGAPNDEAIYKELIRKSLKDIAKLVLTSTIKTMQRRGEEVPKELATIHKLASQESESCDCGTCVGFSTPAKKSDYDRDRDVV